MVTTTTAVKALAAIHFKEHPLCTCGRLSTWLIGMRGGLCDACYETSPHRSAPPMYAPRPAPDAEHIRTLDAFLRQP
jgi:hypothetical protein